MSLLRYYNEEKIIKDVDVRYGEVYRSSDNELVRVVDLMPYDPKLIESTTAEIHLYTLDGEYIGGDTDATYIVQDDISNSILVDVRRMFSYANIDRGSYKIVVNLLKNVIGSFDDDLLYLKEISPDRTEVRLTPRPSRIDEANILMQEFISSLVSISDSDMVNSFIVNFKFNRTAKIIRAKVRDGDLYLKLYDALDEGVELKETSFISFEVMDSYIDNVVLTRKKGIAASNLISRPNFQLDVDMETSDSTTYKTCEDLLDVVGSLRRRIVNTLDTGSMVELNIDYTDFSNFVFYGSAETRVRNFYDKVQKIEYYESQIESLNSLSGSNVISEINSSRITYNTKIDNVYSSFTGYENWLWYNDESLIFTHGNLGENEVYPKQAVSGSNVYYASDSTNGLNWYDTALSSSIKFDEDSNGSFRDLMPEHIIMDGNNTEFFKMLDLMGEFFDELYGYVTNLTAIFERDEHPERGTPNALLPFVAESAGWKLSNVKGTAELWSYLIGSDNSGSFSESGSMKSLSSLNLNNQIWRRIVNNLPYLLKTKGTVRSIEALMNIYGIPQTYISVKEYGGPSVADVTPLLIENTFAYALEFEGSQYIEIPRSGTAFDVIKDIITENNLFFTTEDGFNVILEDMADIQVPNTLEFRFSTKASGSNVMPLVTFEDKVTANQGNLLLSLNHSSVNGDSEVSGSQQYGYLKLSLLDDSGSMYATQTEYLPLYDGDFWNVRMGFDTMESNGTLSIQVQKAADCSDGNIVFDESASLTFTNPIINVFGGDDVDDDVPIFLGGKIGLSYPDSEVVSTNFVGYMQSYKEYFEELSERTFTSHTLNPAAYHSDDAIQTCAMLYRFYPLGVDVQREDHTVVTQISSSHPDRSYVDDTIATMVGFTGDQSTQYHSFREQYYINAPSIGGHNTYSRKIRIEDSTLIHELSPSARGELSRYDTAPLDSNRISIVFSPSDQINRDIFNHSGYANLDDYLGNPKDEFNGIYCDLSTFANSYWKKWQNRYDVNNFIEIFSLYDYSFFIQMRQLIPARVNLIDGILIESPILHRNKSVLMERPVVTNPQWEDAIDLSVQEVDASLILKEGELEIRRTFDAEKRYYTGSIDVQMDVTAKKRYYTGSVDVNVDTDANIVVEYCDDVSMLPTIGGTFNYNEAETDVAVDVYEGVDGEMMPIIDKCKTTCKWKEVIYHYEVSESFGTEYERSWERFRLKCYNQYTSRSLVDTCYQYLENDCRNVYTARFMGTKISSAGWNVDSSDTSDGGPVVSFTIVDDSTMRYSGNSQEGNIEII